MKRETLWLLLAALGILAATSYSVVKGLAMWKESPNAKKWGPLLNATEDKYGLPRDLLFRLAYQESHFRDDIINCTLDSSAGAKGMMQIVPAYHPNVDPCDTPAAIEYAAQFLASLYRQFGSWSLALAAYNSGAGNVAKYGGIPPFAETQAYVSHILADVNAANGSAVV